MIAALSDPWVIIALFCAFGLGGGLGLIVGAIIVEGRWSDLEEDEHRLALEAESLDVSFSPFSAALIRRQDKH